jgi:sirohydrochlorin cobaltochelatase
LSAAIVLLAHGSRDPAWREPFERIAARVAEVSSAEVAIAYLEHGPSLNEVLQRLSGRVRVVPVFLGAGGHVRSDVPRLVEDARAAYPTTRIELDPAIGEAAAVIEAIARVICGR